jgi:hypothetical protein
MNKKFRIVGLLLILTAVVTAAFAVIDSSLSIDWTKQEQCLKTVDLGPPPVFGTTAVIEVTNTGNQTTADVTLFEFAFVEEDAVGEINPPTTAFTVAPQQTVSVTVQITVTEMPKNPQGNYKDSVNVSGTVITETTRPEHNQGIHANLKLSFCPTAVELVAQDNGAVLIASALPWYQHKSLWLGVGLLLCAMAAIWLIKKRN